MTKTSRKRKDKKAKTLAQPSKVGRPSDYTPELAEKICSLIAEGKSLRRIVEDEAMPSRDAVNQWLHKHPEFQDQYARARELQQEALAEEALDEARNIKTKNDSFRARELNNHIRWMAERLAPKKFGARTHHEIEGNLRTSSMSDEELLEMAREVAKEEE